MTSEPTVLPPPRFVDREAFLVAGLKQRFGNDAASGIPALWQRFVPYLGQIPGQAGQVSYGVMQSDDAASFDYMACVEVGSFDGLPAALDRMRIGATRYAVFPHPGHVSAFSSTIGAIWRQWLPGSGLQAAKAPMFEHYGPGFDPGTGTGDLEVWVPVSG